MSAPWATTEPLLALDVLVDRLERGWFVSEAWDASDFHPYQSLNVSDFVRLVEQAIPHAVGRRFLEVGCGIGTKLVIAAHMGLEVHGIEVRERYIATAQHLCPEASFEIADARGYDRYAAFDIIYCYRPMISPEGEDALEAWITDHAKSGAILLLPNRPKPVGPWSALASSVWQRQ